MSQLDDTPMLSPLNYASVEDFKNLEDRKSNDRLQHFRAVLFRRWIHFKRNKRTFFITFSLTIGFGFLAIVIRWLMLSLLHEQVSDLRFGRLCNSSTEILIARDQFDTDSEPFIQNIVDTYIEDVGLVPTLTNFTSREELNEFMFKNPNRHIVYAVSFNRYSPTWNFTTIHNTSNLQDVNILSRAQTTRMAWKTALGPDSDFRVSLVFLMKKVHDVLYGEACPFIVTAGLLSILPLIVTQPISDIRGEVRDYMVSCSLSLLPYWCACYIIDLCIWLAAITIDWVMFLICQVPAYLDNKLTLWYSFAMMGPSFILFTYCLSFIFKSAEAASRQLFVFLTIAILIPIVISFARMLKSDPDWLCWFYGFIPPVALQRHLTEVCSRFAFNKEPFSYYWKDLYRSRVYLIMQIIDIPFYIFVLWVIENYRDVIAGFQTRRSFSSYLHFFQERKARTNRTTEAVEMEDLVNNSNTHFMVRISHVSRLFFNSSGSPVAAVNDVSLGVRDGSLFGFLGANGAGKTTLIKMITSMIPPSSGSIQIDGNDIYKDHQLNTSLVSVCPQFNTHLCMEMTPREHFYLYTLLHKLDPVVAQSNGEFLIQTLSLTKFADKPVKELSGGNQRKLAVALSFFAPSKLILLDEPTSSLDPVARHEVHGLIQHFRGSKTFMLCTHLLSEAEALCDTISIMVRGCVYTCGSPQYLSRKFGTEYKIDLLLTHNKALVDNNPFTRRRRSSASIDGVHRRSSVSSSNANFDMSLQNPLLRQSNASFESNILKEEISESERKCDAFFAKELPTAKLTINRPGARIYSIPSADIALSTLFRKMGDGKKSGEAGFFYYTCSTSSLERVFMEIVRMSENEEAQEQEAQYANMP